MTDSKLLHGVEALIAPHTQGGVRTSPNARAYLDGLRALAVNLVLLGHASDIFQLGIGFPGGQAGVGIFFLLSGFLIQQSSLARMRLGGPWFWPFLIDRFARIFTAYVPVLVLVAIVNAALPLGKWGQDGTATGPLAFIGNLFLLQDYPLFQVGHSFQGALFRIRSYNAAEPFWTIPIEFSIYIVFGLFCFLLIGRERINRVAGNVLFVVSLPVVLWNAAAGGGSGLSLTWLLGALAAYVWVSAWQRSPGKQRLGWVVLVVGLVCLLGRAGKIGLAFEDHGMIVLEALVILGVLAVVDSARTAPATLRAAVEFLAAYSYSLYLVHNTVLVIFRTQLTDSLGRWTAPAAMVAAHLCALLVYVLFERHYRQVGRWLKRWATTPAPQPSIAQ